MKVKYFLIWLGRFQDPQQCQSPLLYIFFFGKANKQTNKKIIAMSFFICHNLWNLHCLETVKRSFRHLLSWMCWSANEDGPRQLDSFLTRCCRTENLAVCEANDWGVCVGVVVFVGVCWWLIGWVILPIWLIQCYRSEIAESPVFFFCFVFISNSLPVIVWSNLSLSSCIEPLFHLKEPLPIYYLQMFHGCTVAQSHC